MAAAARTKLLPMMASCSCGALFSIHLKKSAAARAERMVATWVTAQEASCA